MLMNPGYYSCLIETQKQYPNPAFHQIEVDLRRTYSDISDSQRLE